MTNKRPSYLDSIPSSFQLLTCPLGNGRFLVSSHLHPSTLSKSWVVLKPLIHPTGEVAQADTKLQALHKPLSPPLPEGRMPGDPESRPRPGNLGKVVHLGLDGRAE